MGSVENLLNWGVALRFVAIGTYAAAFVGYAARLAIQRLKLDRAATALAALGVVTHTAYLVTRWIAAGQIEILAREQTGDVISSYDRFWFMVSHPPYTNLFDALNFAAGAAVLLSLVGGLKLFTGAEFQMAPGWQHQVQSRLHAGKLLDVTTAVHVMAGDKAVKFFTPVAGVGPFLLGAIALFIAGAFIY